jgi:hypothetical protein
MGHTDIVLTLDVVLLEDEGENQKALILSGAKDNNIKLWRFSSQSPF